MFIDTHAHLWWHSYADDLAQVIDRATKAGVKKIIAPGTDLLSSKKSVELARIYPGVVYAAVGIHPEETINKTLAVTKNPLMFNSQMAKMRDLIAQNREFVVAVGEIGTDANTQELRDSLPLQMNLMREQCEIALEFDLPVIIHTRKSLDETMTVLESLSAMPRGQFHCFSYDAEALPKVLAHGFYVSFCGNITWSKRLQRILPLVPDDKLLLETDSPLMMPRTPVGEPVDPSLRNEPRNVTILATLQAEIKSLSLEQFARHTTDNAERLYRL